MDIALKHSMSVDFPKTGNPPEPLRRLWEANNVEGEEGGDGKELPPERPERFPDFMAKTHEPAYVSPRLVGQLYRLVKLLYLLYITEVLQAH
jgi:hypothetical protein